MSVTNMSEMVGSYEAVPVVPVHACYTKCNVSPQYRNAGGATNAQHTGRHVQDLHGQKLLGIHG